MQGVVFTLFGDLIVDKYGMEMWNRLIAETNPPSEGVYTAGQRYPSNEIISYVAALSEIENAPAEELLNTFGKFMFPHLLEMNPIDISNGMSLREFLSLIDDTIHVEVKRLNPDVYLPSFKTYESDQNKLVMEYHSKRKLCALSVGLIEGAAEHFCEEITIVHATCMHRGDEHCRFEIEFRN